MFVAYDESDGIIWGLGASPEATREDAKRWIAEGDPGGMVEVSDLKIEAVTFAQAQRVEAGDCHWPLK
jgi:hypothetical protein